MTMKSKRGMGLLGSMAIATLALLHSQTAAIAPAHAQSSTANLPKHNFCQRQESMFLALETKNFLINICGGDAPYTYVGVDRKTRKSIRLPLEESDPQGRFFHAVNRDYHYILAQTPRGKFLTVSQGERELLREPVLKGW